MLSVLSNMAKPLFIVMLLAGVAFSQYYFDIEKEDRPLAPPVILPAQAMRLGNLGLHSASSVLMWIYSIQEMATWPKKIPELIMTVTDIDQKFSYPYAFAALVLPPLGFQEEAFKIGIKGLRNADPDWRIAYYMATSYHIFLKDRSKATLYFNIAADTPGAPEKIKSISARYGIAGHLEETKRIWTSIYETSDDEIVLERAKRNIIHIEIVEILNKAIAIYKQKYGFYPKSTDDLVNGKIIKNVPISPLGVEFSIGNEGKILIQ
ncbi:MAG: hypothetical protein A3B91_03625 [Candidatus Yanofskybacteria bacterium RIFCSPHIGHO2_02_FULL_41_29]|uniref:Uncharacterized protein n=1 Tax=Candidatus Yanofskybacteria bacterium RIFCSPHIGHO2_01_FULL_41_53 TaxID=1802663 RepID=A0A1F8EKM9_9BACT|nr:MAG: hypothetical protein A2650_00720 [Candidatus Yanofskybacteria bacterium RIFCSPHIGHO2_01_FULL_41_53]OGN10848.1 MAG: hypothetical protein A3B91_03625 [Candidatus Yanofskybacteria bacterium RIFCSPHIGHO2_02_FULL_41_29]OGN18540.1 MAG: hypothetical protein A3F48_01190 [Candidatus Yanofskybacteria bacterium RIFCSPHIGHO2_12_FULL_41_9]OGN24489.1 MAG: hypothetical protein A2916_02555 [Candidatus Yanofskybacteria bacterium RIFCSPLOWO2_01_FULL_41_67]OGN29517.1 MAG: hypothetical protein A3H54_01265 